MTTEIIQVRDVPASDVDVLRTRAAARGLSLSSYLRELIHQDVSRPVMAEVLERIAGRSRNTATDADIREFIDDDRP